VQGGVVYRGFPQEVDPKNSTKLWRILFIIPNKLLVQNSIFIDWNTSNNILLRNNIKLKMYVVAQKNKRLLRQIQSMHIRYCRRQGFAVLLHYIINNMNTKKIFSLKNIIMIMVLMLHFYTLTFKLKKPIKKTKYYLIF